MATLQGAIDELIVVVDAVAGVNWAPSDPPPTVPIGPAAIVYASSGFYGGEAYGTYEGKHNIEIPLLLPEGSQEQQVQALLPLLELIIDALYGHRKGSTSSHYETFVRIDYTFGPVTWDAQRMTGFVFTIIGLKITNTVT